MVTKILLDKVQKRDGSIVPFDADRITIAIGKAMRATGEGSDEEAKIVCDKVIAGLNQIRKILTLVKIYNEQNDSFFVLMDHLFYSFDK